jgi:hypothetical protein
MTSLPIKKEIEELLQKERSGIWEIKDKDQYLKVTSELEHHPIRIPVSEYGNLKDAVADAVMCAKVYKRLIEIGLYHPKTEIVIFKDDKDYLSLMVTMPKLEILEDIIDTSGLIKKLVALYTIKNNIRKFKSKLSLKKTDYWDLDPLFNWGFDEGTHKLYAHDLHIGLSYGKVLELADSMGIK